MSKRSAQDANKRFWHKHAEHALQQRSKQKQGRIYDGPYSILLKGFVLMKTGSSSTLIANPFFGRKKSFGCFQHEVSLFNCFEPFFVFGSVSSLSLWCKILTRCFYLNIWVSWARIVFVSKRNTFSTNKSHKLF